MKLTRSWGRSLFALFLLNFYYIPSRHVNIVTSIDLT